MNTLKHDVLSANMFLRNAICVDCPIDDFLSRSTVFMKQALSGEFSFLRYSSVYFSV